MPNQKCPCDNAEEETSGFLFDHSFDICTSGVLVVDEDQLSTTMTQFQPASDSEWKIGEELLSDPTINGETDPESLTRFLCFAATSHHPTASDNPTASVSLIERQQFLQAIFDGVSNHFPELSFTMACNGNSSAPV